MTLKSDMSLNSLSTYYESLISKLISLPLNVFINKGEIKIPFLGDCCKNKTNINKVTCTMYDT